MPNSAVGTLHCRYAFPALKRRAIIQKSLRDSLCRSEAGLQPGSSRPVQLEIFRRLATLGPCRSTNFIVTNATGTAKSSCAPPTGREPNARTAARRGCRRNYLCSRPVLPGTLRSLSAQANRVRAGCAARVSRSRTELLKRRAEEVWIQACRTLKMTNVIE